MRLAIGVKNPVKGVHGGNRSLGVLPHVRTHVETLNDLAQFATSHQLTIGATRLAQHFENVVAPRHRVVVVEIRN